MKITKEVVIPNYGLEGTQGPDGKPAIYTTVTNQNIVLNAPYQGLPSDYSKANGSIKVFEGDKEVTQQATYTLKQTLNVASELDFNKFKVTHVSTDNGMFIVTVSYKEFVSDIMITTNVVRNGQSGPKGDNGQDGPPTGIIESPTIPTEVYQGMLWKNTGNLSGFITDVTYIYRGSKWEKYIFTADNIYADNLSAITANLGDVTGGSFTGSKFINTYDSRFIGDTWQRGSLRIEDGVLKDESEYYKKTTGEVTNTNNFYTLHNSLEQSSTDIKTGHHQVGRFSSSGIILTDSKLSDYGTVNLGYQDLMNIPATLLQPAAGFAYHVSGNPYAIRYGRNIQLTGAFTPTNSFDNDYSNLKLVTTLPVWARPEEDRLTFLQQGSGSYEFLIEINSDGKLYVGRYRDFNGRPATVPIGQWINVCLNFVAKDI